MTKEIEIVSALMKFTDDPDDKQPVSVNIGIIASQEQAEELSAGIESDNPYWYNFDSDIFAYVHTYLGERIEDYYSKETTPNDFILVKEEN